MGFVTVVGAGRTIPIPSECLLGRSDACAVRFDRADVSSEHASLRWSGARWELRDLASRNGTYLDGVRLLSGQRAALRRGSRVGVGAAGAALELTDDGPPRLAALELDSDRWLAAEGGVLALPDDDSPELCVIHQPEAGFLCQTSEGARVVRSGETLVLGTKRFRLHLPVEVAPTLDAECPAVSAAAPPCLTFRVSRDEEYIELDATTPDRAVRSLGARAHHYLLLCLAKLRARDAADSNLDPAEHGWVHLDELGDMLRLDKNHLYVSIHRARRQLTALHIEQAAAVVEARPGTGMVRFGYPDFRIQHH
jgi:hypothetical protein